MIGGKNMWKIKEDKWKQLKSADEHFNEEYGPEGSPTREAFEARAKAYYYAEILKEQRKMQKMTQQQLADKIGKKREFISNIERGNSDMQLSTFMLISNALGLRFSLVVGWDEVSKSFFCLIIWLIIGKLLILQPLVV